MVQKIFLIIATFCIAQVKSYPGGYPGDFPKAVFLSNASSFWGNEESKRSFQDCYNKIKESHKQVIDRFSFQVTYAAERLQFDWNKWQDVRFHEKKILPIAENLSDLLKKYQQYFSTYVMENRFDQIQWLVRDYDILIDRVEKKLDKKFADLKNRSFMRWEIDFVKKCEKIFEEELTNVTKRSDEVMKSLEKCMEEKLVKSDSEHK